MERRLSGDKDGKRDLLSGLITANDEFSDDGEQRLKDEELIGTGPRHGLRTRLFNVCRSGNMFMFYLAGHEVRGSSRRGRHTYRQRYDRHPDIPSALP